ncbi:hypothetical protein J3B02_006199, partial [Coemansia erecta]
GNFSFASSLARKLGTAQNIVATAFDSLEIVNEKYLDAGEHIKTFEQLGGTVLFDVDATMALGKVSGLRGRMFSHIVFNFPHAGAGIKDQDRNIISNQRLLMGFFASAIPLLAKGSGCTTAGTRPDNTENGNDDDGDDDDNDDIASGASRGSRKRKSPGNGEVFEFEGAQATVTIEADPQEQALENSEPPKSPGQIHVTLKSGPPYSHWNVRQLAKDSGLVSLSTVPFDLEAFPGYEHRRTLGFKDGVSRSENQEIRNKDPKIYMFVVRQQKPADAQTMAAGAGTGESGSRGKRSRKLDGVTSETFGTGNFAKKKKNQ